MTGIEMPPLDAELIYILGRPNFACGALAAQYRIDGASIAPKAEHEQAFVIHRMLGHYLADPVTWREAWKQEVEALIKRRTLALGEVQP